MRKLAALRKLLRIWDDGGLVEDLSEEEPLYDSAATGIVSSVRRDYAVEMGRASMCFFMPGNFRQGVLPLKNCLKYISVRMIACFVGTESYRDTATWEAGSYMSSVLQQRNVRQWRDVRLSCVLL